MAGAPKRIVPSQDACVPGTSSVGSSKTVAFFHADARARSSVFEAAAARRRAGRTSTFPLVLLTGRGSSAQWHTETRTEQVGDAASGWRPPASTLLEIHPVDARERRASVQRSAACVVRVEARDRLEAARAGDERWCRAGSVFLVDARRGDQSADLRVSFDPYSRSAELQALRGRDRARRSRAEIRRRVDSHPPARCFLRHGACRCSSGARNARGTRALGVDFSSTVRAPVAWKPCVDVLRSLGSHPGSAAPSTRAPSEGWH